MKSKPLILSILLALTMVAGNVVLSGHVSSHKTVAYDYCSLCTQAAGSDSAATPDSDTLLVYKPRQIPGQDYATTFALPVTLYDHPSRAPPRVT